MQTAEEEKQIDVTAQVKVKKKIGSRRLDVVVKAYHLEAIALLGSVDKELKLVSVTLLNKAMYELANPSHHGAEFCRH